jgi:hypothetical protein
LPCHAEFDARLSGWVVDLRGGPGELCDAAAAALNNLFIAKCVYAMQFSVLFGIANA